MADPIIITAASIGTLLLDASLNELHTAEVEVTDHPVERGANIADHKRRKPDIVQIEGVISNTPIPRATDPIVQRTTRTGGVVFSSRGEIDTTRVPDAYDSLQQLADSEDLIQVVTALRTYDNMLMTSLTVPRDARTGQVLRFTAILKQVRVVSSQTVQVADTKKNVSLGKKAATPTPPAEKRASTLKKLADTKAGDTLLKAMGLR